MLEVEQCEALSRRLEKILDGLLMSSAADDCLDWVDWLHREVAGAVQAKQRITWG